MPTRMGGKPTLEARKKQEVIVIEDTDEEEVKPLSSIRTKRALPTRVKLEKDVDDIVSVLGGISLNVNLNKQNESQGGSDKKPSTPIKGSDVKKEIVDLSYISPFPTPAPSTRINKTALVAHTPLFLPDKSDIESEVDSDWAPKAGRKGKTVRRIIRDPDSDSDNGNPSAGPSESSPAIINASSPISIASSPPSVRPAKSRAGPSTKPNFAAAKYLDLEARRRRDVSSDEDEDEREEKEKKWRLKYYDESLGSLKDFIVDDDYESEDEEEEDDDESEEEESSASEEDDRRNKGKRVLLDKKPIIKSESIKPRSIPKIIQKEEIIEICDSDSSIIHSDYPDQNSDIDSQSDVEALLHFSPPPSRLHALPDLAALTLHADESDSEPSTPPRASVARRAIPVAPKTPGSKKQWGLDRTRIAQAIFDELDKKVFESKLGSKGAKTVLEWNNRLLTTAGQAHSKRTKKNDGTKIEEVKIILSEKVLTGEDQIVSTVAHEMCHVASWIINDERKNPHGKVFKNWGRKVMKVRPDIEVTTKHDYQIEYKFHWRCTGSDCDKIYKRHSKSIDIEKQACGRCRSKLEPLFETKKETAFQVYLRQNLAVAKFAMPGSTHGEVMRALSRQWTEGGPEGDHKAHWSAMALAAAT